MTTTVRVAHYDDALPLTYSDGSRTDRVVHVDVTHGDYRHRLIGYDFYWLALTHGLIGCFNHPDNRGWYGADSIQALALSLTDRGMRFTEPSGPPADATIYVGVMLPAHHAVAIGLIRDESEQPRRP